MRLYLSSFRLSGPAKQLPALVGGAGRAAVVANAMDAQTPEQRAGGVYREMTALTELGLRPEPLDLRDFFDRTDIRPALARFDLLWLRGGNVFMLRHALAPSGADAAIIDLLAADAVCYGGYSAGPCVLGKSIEEFWLVDDPKRVLELHNAPAPTSGLGILDWAFVPHVDSPGHPESERCGAVAQLYQRRGADVRRFREGEVLIINGADERMCGIEDARQDAE